MKALHAGGTLLSLVLAPCSALTLGTEKSIGSQAGRDGKAITSSRRKWIQQSILVASTSMVAVNPKVVFAEDDNRKVGLLSTADVAELLHPVPTFTIVDKRGFPFMVVGEGAYSIMWIAILIISSFHQWISPLDAKVTGYFFTTYGEAARILKLAKDSVNKAIAQAKAEGKSKEEIGINPWLKARVSSIPLDIAITLVTKSTSSFGGGNYFRSELELLCQ